MPIAPSFATKLDRAEKHLIDLKAAVENFGGADDDSRPYTVRTRIEGKKKREVHRLHFTRQPDNTEIPMIVADAIYNLRSSLEHLMAALVGSKDRDSVTFPIFWRGVWNDFIEGENEQRRKDRQRWRTISRAAPKEAVAFLKRLQPPDDDPRNPEPHQLRILNRLSNDDRHTKLPVFAAGLEGVIVDWRMPDNSIIRTGGIADAAHIIEDQAELTKVPPGAVYMKCFGPPHVVVRTAMRDQHGPVNLPVVELVENTLNFIRNEVVPPLIPYVHPGPRPKRSGKRRR